MVVETADPLTLPGVAIAGRTGVWDVRTERGLIASVTRSADAAAAPPARVVLPAFLDVHIHLEKAFLLDRMARDADDIADAIAMTRAMKPDFTPDDMRERASRVLDRAVAHGVTAVRAHVEVDDVLGLTAVEAVLELRERYAGRVDVRLAVFPQEGILTQRRGAEWMAEALDLGAHAVGGIPYNDVDPDRHLDHVFALAEDRGLPLDLHIDLSDDPTRLDVRGVIRRVRERRFPHPVTLGHLTSLGSAPRDDAARIADELAELRINVVTLPATDVYLGGRGDPERPRRGLTPVRLLQAAGVNVALATNNIQNPFTPLGRGNILDIARLFAEVAQFGTADDADEVIRMLTSRAASAAGIPGRTVEPGEPADLLVFAGSSARHVLNEADRPERVYARGRLVASEGRPIAPREEVA